VFSGLVDNYAVPLFRPFIMSAVLDIIVENTPELRALDLSENKLYELDSLSVLAPKVPNLRVLHVGKNQVSCGIQTVYCSIIFQFVTCDFVLYVEAF
jgi:hypothetical protein